MISRLCFLLFLMVFAQLSGAQTRALENGVSPDGRFEVVLEADIDDPAFSRYELKGEDDQFPAYLVLQRQSGKILMRIRYPADSHSDKQPLRKHTKVLWSPLSTAVAINTRERFYTHTSLAVFDPGKVEFRRVELPDYETLTSFSKPDSRKLKPRGASWVSAWTSEGHFIYESRLASLVDEELDPLRHRVELSIGAEGCKVVKRLPISAEEE
jgi:hypothetical protein